MATPSSKAYSTNKRFVVTSIFSAALPTLQCREEDAAKFAAILDAPTAQAVNVERAFQNALGGGCHTAFAAHVSGDVLHLFHENVGARTVTLTAADFAAPTTTAARVLKELKLLN